jgi:hypothetical protein
VEWAERCLKKPGSVAVTTAKDLLIQLNGITEGTPKDMHRWPQNPESLAHRLVRLAPVLRAQGIEVRRMPRTRTAWSRWEILRSGPQGVLIPPIAEDEAA